MSTDAVVSSEYCSCLAVVNKTSSLALNLLGFMSAQNDTNNSSDYGDNEEEWNMRVMRLLKFTMSGGTIFTNFMLVLAIAINRIAISANVRFIFSLALSDLLCGICGFLDDPFYASIFECERHVVNSVIVVAHFTALLTILGLAIDHYLAICRCHLSLSFIVVICSRHLSLLCVVVICSRHLSL